MIPTLIPKWRIAREPRVQRHQTSPDSKGQWRYCPVMLSANGRIKPDVVKVNGREERHPEGAYYLEWREGGKRIRLSVGKDAADASARRLRKEAELNAINNGVTCASPEGQNGHRLVSAAVTAVPGRDEAHQEAQNSRGLRHLPALLHGILPEALSRRSPTK